MEILNITRLKLQKEYWNQQNIEIIRLNTYRSYKQ